VAACIEPLPVPKARPIDTDEGHIYVDTTFSYYRFFVPEAGTDFPNIGFAVDVAYLLTDKFALVSRVNVLTVGDDPSGEQLTDFSTVRLSLGGGFSYPLWNGWVRPYLYLSGEAANFGRFERTTDFFCKVNKNARVCDEDDIISEAPGWLYGASARAGLSVRLYQAFHATISTGFSFYFIPRDLPALNFPLGLDTGLEYRF
jgi:hypothetical protein